MNIDRAHDIIAAYGADARRWPDAERADVLALAAQDGVVAKALAETRIMDTLLADWANAGVPAPAFDPATLERRRPIVSPVSRRRWLAGGVLALATTAVVVVMTPAPLPLTPDISSHSPVRSATAEGSVPGSDADAFARVFTPTVDEDELI